MIKIDYLRSDIIRFLIVGTVTVIIDYSFYCYLLSIGLSIYLAKGIGFFTGTIFSYFANKFWTFSNVKKKSASLWRFILTYALNLVINVTLNTSILYMLVPSSFSIIFAFVFATGISATLNFLGMKYFVFSVSKPIKELV